MCHALRQEFGIQVGYQGSRCGADASQYTCLQGSYLLISKDLIGCDDKETRASYFTTCIQNDNARQSVSTIVPLVIHSHALSPMWLLHLVRPHRCPRFLPQAQSAQHTGRVCA